MFKKNLTVIMAMVIFLMPALSLADTTKELNVTTYYPSPNADFKTLRVNTVEGSDSNYYQEVAGKVTCPSGDCPGMTEHKNRVLGSNADYLDGLNISYFAPAPTETCWPWPLLYGAIEGLTLPGFEVSAQAHLLSCGTGNYAKGFLYFSPALEVSLCIIFSAVTTTFFGSPLPCDELPDIEVGVAGIGLCCSFEGKTKCDANGDLAKFRDLCTNLGTWGMIPQICLDYLPVFKNCAWDPYAGLEAQCNNCANMNWVKGFFTSICWLNIDDWFCCEPKFKQVCMTETASWGWGGVDKTECGITSGSSTTLCTSFSHDDCYRHCSSYTCGKKKNKCCCKSAHTSDCVNYCPNYRDDCFTAGDEC